MAPDPRDLLDHPRAQRLQSRARLALARRPRAYHRAHQAWAVGRYLLRVPHDPDFRTFARFSEREGLFLDVGANIGQSAMSLRGLTGTLAAHRPILLVERSGESEVEELLAPLGYRPFAYLEGDDRLEPLAGRQTTNVFYLTAKDEAAAIGAVPCEP